eukprot:CAMPEP_0173116474 /NCGR_PEP_ID=MMETSP1102-20130122/49405_1 /TAXON_ID=49646 /ORGANISM="Geminigera sp., Strain Caron Lab Isolate" /LENGTH=70 /DNA_ID=CAMNT_0014020283 /DNA_START=1 /DNA_END=210 /DNA_ORIENTATION=+
MRDNVELSPESRVLVPHHRIPSSPEHVLRASQKLEQLLQDPSISKFVSVRESSPQHAAAPAIPCNTLQHT